MTRGSKSVLKRDAGVVKLGRGERARSVTYQLEAVLCGKRHCQKRHAAYWYAYWKAPGGRIRKRYIGRVLREVTSAEIRRAEQPSTRETRS